MDYHQYKGALRFIGWLLKFDPSGRVPLMTSENLWYSNSFSYPLFLKAKIQFYPMNIGMLDLSKTMNILVQSCVKTKGVKEKSHNKFFYLSEKQNKRIAYTKHGQRDQFYVQIQKLSHHTKTKGKYLTVTSILNLIFC